MTYNLKKTSCNHQPSGTMLWKDSFSTETLFLYRNSSSTLHSMASTCLDYTDFLKHDVPRDNKKTTILVR